MTFWKRQNYGDNKNTVVARGLWGRERIGRAQGIFTAEKLFCMIP